VPDLDLVDGSALTTGGVVDRSTRSKRWRGGHLRDRFAQPRGATRPVT